jgi:trans-aconitate 2-methyltransferase
LLSGIIMAWNPDIYNKFKSERYAPFQDLLAMITVRPDMSVIDLGCGTGELTRKLADHLPGAVVEGIDSSEAMLEKAKAFANEHLSFSQSSIQHTLQSGGRWDLVFSHAAIQWIDDHMLLLPQMIRCEKAGGQLAVQLPSNHGHITHTLLDGIARTEPYRTAFGGWTRVVATLDIERYAEILFEEGGTDINIYEKAYPHVLENAAALFDWMSGTALIRYLDRLPAALRDSFAKTYRAELERHFTGTPVFYPFKRILMAARF